MNLTRFKKYSRQDFHNMFTPQKAYVEGAGVWGIRGIVKVPDTEKDFVFFVTLGTKEGEHTFDEGMTKKGLFIWQSQPGQKLEHLQIRKFINHNHTSANIYLLFRANSTDKYTYVGRLAYHSHDETREMPVHFIWQILDVGGKIETIQKLGMPVKKSLKKFEPSKRQSRKQNKLTKSDTLPNPTKEGSRSGPKKEGKKDHDKASRENKKIGDAGELLVMKWEQEQLKQYGIDKEVVHVALEDDNKGYDIISYDLEGKPIYIEVKTTGGGKQTPFFISPNEVEQSKKLGDRYRVYRLYNFDSKTNTADWIELKGDVSQYVELVPTQYQIRYK